jgi:hypothetical protein
MSYEKEMLNVLHALRETGQVIMDQDRAAKFSTPLIVATAFFAQLAVLHGYDKKQLHEIVDEVSTQAMLSLIEEAPVFVQDPPSQVQ